jgi:acyl-CoA synthetase (NDP forming)
LTGDDAVAEAVLAEHGVIRVRDTEQMLDFAYAARQRIYPANNSLGVITVSGGAGIVATDEAEIAGLPMPLMPEDAQARLKEILPFGAPANPLDCTAQALNDLSLFEEFSRAALKDGGYRSILCFLTYVAGGATLAPRLLETLRTIREDFPDRLLALCIIASPEVTLAYEDAGFLTFTDPSRAVRAISAMGRVGDMLAAKPAARPELPRVTLPERSPDEHAAKALLAEAGIAAAPERIVQSADEAVAVAEALGFPVVMKIVSPDIVHKSDIGGVRLGLGDAEAVRAAYDGILDAVRVAAPQARIAGILVARQLSGGVECLMGISRDPVFGPVAVFGLGGVFVEILDDVAIRPCPFDAATAREMILSIKAAGVLTGARGRPPADVDALAAMLSRLSAFAAAAGPRLRAIDLNPVLALPERAYALDAVIEIDAEAAA